MSQKSSMQNDLIPYGYIYKITNKINGNSYIGSRKLSCDRYWRDYLGSGTLIKQAIKKYGEENFTKTLLEYCWSNEELLDRELEYIRAAKESGQAQYNIFTGLTSGRTWHDNFTDGDKEKFSKNISLAMKNSEKAKEASQKLVEKRKEYYQTVFSEVGEGIIRDYESGIGVEEIRKKYNIPRRRIYAFLEENNVELRDMTKYGHKERKDVSLKKSRTIFKKNNPDLNYDDHHDENGNRLFDKVCEMCDKEYRSMRKDSKYCSEKCTDISLERQHRKVNVTKEKLQELSDMGYTLEKIAEYYGCSVRTITNKKKMFGLTRK